MKLFYIPLSLFTSGPIVGHVGDGNFHVILLVNPENEDETKRAHSLSDRIVKYVIQFDDEILVKL